MIEDRHGYCWMNPPQHPPVYGTAPHSAKCLCCHEDSPAPVEQPTAQTVTDVPDVWPVSAVETRISTMVSAPTRNAQVIEL